MPAVLVGAGEISAYRNGRQAGVTFPRFGDEGITVTVGQSNVADHDVDRVGVEERQSAGDRLARADMMAPAPENGGERYPRVVMIFDEEDGAHERGREMPH